MKQGFLLLLLLTCFTHHYSRAQLIRHSYRFDSNLSVSKPECGDGLLQMESGGNCQPGATPGVFISDNIPLCNTRRPVYHNNLNWGLGYTNTAGTIGKTYTISMYIKNTTWSQNLSRIIDFSNGASDDGIYFSQTSGSADRCMTFKPNGVSGACPSFNNTTYYLLTFTRNGQTGVLDVYVNNTLFTSVNDSGQKYIGQAGVPIYLLRDDAQVSCQSGEANFAFLLFTNEYSTKASVDKIYNEVCTPPGAVSFTADFSVDPDKACGFPFKTTVTYKGGLPATGQGYTFQWDWDGATVISGTGMGPYVIQWNSNGTKNVTLNIVSNTCGTKTTGTHQVIISGPGITAATKNSSCPGKNDGMITINATGGTPPFQYSVDSVRYQKENVFNVAANPYRIYVKDLNGCVSAMSVIVSADNISVRTIADTTICAGEQVKLFTTSAANNFAWSPSAGLSNTTAKEPLARPASTTSYTVTSVNGTCMVRDTVKITVIPPVEVSSIADIALCQGQSVKLTTTSNGTSFSWTPAVGLDDPSSKDPVASPALTTTYIVTSSLGRCSKKDTVKVTVIPPVQVIATNDTTIEAGKSFQLSAASPQLSGVSGVTFSWTPATGLNNPSVANPTALLAFDQTYQVTVSSPQGCKGSATVNLIVIRPPALYLPDAFTPDGDGKNDLLLLVSYDLKTLNYFKVFNRWGEIVYFSQSLDQGWDGRGQLSGNYLWTVEAVTNQGKVIRKKGTVLLIR